MSDQKDRRAPIFHWQIRRGALKVLRVLGCVCALSLVIFKTESELRAAPPGRPNDPVPGSVKLKYGLILRGMCSPVSSVGEEPGGRTLELRMIDQGFRQIYVPRSRSEPVVADPGDWPNISFTVPQKRTGNKYVPEIIGVPSVTPFDDHGITTITLTLPQNVTIEIRAGIVSLNELFAEVRGLTHDWEWKIPLSSIPDDRLQKILERVTDFQSDPWKRLELSRMLMLARRYTLAESLLETVQNVSGQENAPKLAHCKDLYTELRRQLGQQILQEIELRRESGQYRLAAAAGRVFPQEEIPPEDLLRARQLTEGLEEGLQRIEWLKQRLNHLLSGIEDPARHQQSAEMIQAVQESVDLSSISTFTPFELLGRTDDLTPDAGIALAVSCWMLGADEAIQSFSETQGLFEARQLVLDYLRTTSEESELRGDLIQRLQGLEGVSAERLTAMISHLPPVHPIRIDSTSSVFRTEAGDDVMGCMGIVPPEYSEHRSYPLIIAFSRELLTAEQTLRWWQDQAARHGYIVVCPEAYDSEAAGYDASAEQHRRFLQLVRRLKTGLRIDDDRVFIAGHGIGGEAAMDMATAHPELFAGVISISGLGRRHFQWLAKNAPSMPWYVVVGGRQGIWYERLNILLSRLMLRNTATQTASDILFVKYPERGFEMFTEESPHVFEWMKLAKRTTFPEQLNAQLLRSTDLSWSWIQLTHLPERYAQLDGPTQWADEGFKPAELEARLSNNNVLRISAAPSPVTLRLSPEMPVIDLQKPLTVVTGREKTVINYRPAVSDMLEELRLTGDRKRLCYMKVPLRPKGSS